MWDEAEQFLEKDRYLGLVVKKHRPCMIKPVAKKDYFETLIRSIVGQQLSGKAARTIYGRLKEKVNGKMTPRNLLKLEKGVPRSCGLSNAKSVYVLDLARNVEIGVLHLSAFDKHTDEEVIKELMIVKGIGVWTAQMFLMFSLARPNVFPVDDLGVRKGMEKVVGKSMNKDEMQEFAKRWEPYKTVASWYLWRVVDD